jgi:hypothetical protein
MGEKESDESDKFLFTRSLRVFSAKNCGLAKVESLRENMLTFLSSKPALQKRLHILCRLYRIFLLWPVPCIAIDL